MHKNLKDIQEIDEYIGGHLDTKHRNEFEEKLKQDNTVQQELNNTKQVIEGVQGFAFKKMLRDMHSRLFPNNE